MHPACRNGRRMAEQGPLGGASSQLNGSAPADDFDLAAWVRRSTAAQGVPEKLADQDVILAVARLLMPVLNPRLSRRPRLRAFRVAGRRPGQEEAASAS
jgi:hypothetical protein